MADIRSLGITSSNLTVFKDNEALQSVKLSDRTEDASKNWTPTQVPDGAIAVSHDGVHTWVLFSRKIERWVTASRTQDSTYVPINLDADDTNPNDIAAKGDWIFVTFADSLKIRSYKKQSDTRTVSRTGGRRIGLPGVGTRNPLSVQKFLDGFLVTASTGTNLNYYYVTKAGNVTRSTHVSRGTVVSTPRSRRVQTGTTATTREEITVTDYRDVPIPNSYRRGTQACTGKTAELSTASAASSAARRICTGYSGNLFERETTPSSRVIPGTAGTDDQPLSTLWGAWASTSAGAVRPPKPADPPTRSSPTSDTRPTPGGSTRTCGSWAFAGTYTGSDYGTRSAALSACRGRSLPSSTTTREYRWSGSCSATSYKKTVPGTPTRTPVSSNGSYVSTRSAAQRQCTQLLANLRSGLASNCSIEDASCSVGTDTQSRTTGGSPGSSSGPVRSTQSAASGDISGLRAGIPSGSTNIRTWVASTSRRTRTVASGSTSETASSSQARRDIDAIRSQYPGPRYSVSSSRRNRFHDAGPGQYQIRYWYVYTVTETIPATYQARATWTGPGTTTTITVYRGEATGTRVCTRTTQVDRWRYSRSYQSRTCRTVTTPPGTEYRKGWLRWTRGTAGTQPRTVHWVTVTVYNRIQNTRRVPYQRGTGRYRTVGGRPVYGTRTWTEYVQNIKRLYGNARGLYALNYKLEASTRTDEFRFGLDLNLSSGTSLIQNSALSTSRFNAMAAATTVRNNDITSARAGLLGTAYISRFVNSNYLSNLALGADKAIMFVPEVVATATAQTSARMRTYEVDLATRAATEITGLRYAIHPSAATNLADVRDCDWQGTNTTSWQNLAFRRSNNVIRITNLNPLTTTTQALAGTPTTINLSTGSGFAFTSTTDWAAGVQGGIWLTGTTTSAVVSRQKKDAYTHATKKYKWIDYWGSNVVAMQEDGEITLFTESNGVLTVLRSCPKSWLPSNLQASSLAGVTMNATTIYVGYNNPDQVLAITVANCRYNSGQNIPQSVIDPASVPRYTFNVLDKTIQKINEEQDIVLEEANGGTGTFTYEVVGTISTHLSLSFENGVLKLTADARIPLGRYNIGVRATPADGQNLGGPRTDGFVLVVRPRDRFQISQDNLRYDTILGDVRIELSQWNIKNVALPDIADRFLATRVSWVSSTGDDAAAADWAYEGNDTSRTKWYEDRGFTMKNTLPVGTHTFKYEVLENDTSDSYTDVGNFEAIGTTDSSVNFTVTVTTSPSATPLTPIFEQGDIFFQKGGGDASFILARAFGGTNVFTYGVSNLPTGVSFDAALRRLSIDDDTVLAGSYTIQHTYQQRNVGNTADVGSLARSSFILHVTTLSNVTINQKDIIFAPSLITRTESGRRIFLAQPEGGTGRYNLTLDGLPANVTFNDSPPSLFFTRETPIGIYTVQYRAQAIDNLGNARGEPTSATFNIQVIAFDAAKQALYSYAAVYKWIDGNGKEHFSGVLLKRIRLVGKIGEFYQGAQISVNVTVDKIRITDKVPVVVEIYRTQANLNSRHRVAQIDFLDDDQVVQFTDAVPDNQIANNELVYVSNTVSSNIQPEGATTMQVFPYHLLIAGMGNDKRRLLISRQFAEESVRNVPVEFDFGTSYVLPEEILSIKRIEGLCVVFTVSRIFFINISRFVGVTDVQQLSQIMPVELQTSRGIVPDSKNAIVRLPEGLIFKSINGIYMITRSNTLQYIGMQVEHLNKYKCVKAALSNKRKEVYFLLDNNKILIFNLDFKRWSVIDADDVTDIAVFRGDLIVLKFGKMYAYETDNFRLGSSGEILESHLKRVIIETQWVQVNQINGFSLLRELVLLGNYNNLSRAKVTVHYDFNESDFDTYFLDLNNRSELERVRIQLKRYKCSSFKVIIEAFTRKSCSFSGFTIEYSVDPRAALGVGGANTSVSS